VQPPKGELEHIHYFCGNVEIAADLAAHEPQCVALYKATVALVRAYANIADELEAAGLQHRGHHAHQEGPGTLPDLREIIRKASGETSTSRRMRPTCGT
jgi:type I restriction enzyme R subunit